MSVCLCVCVCACVRSVIVDTSSVNELRGVLGNFLQTVQRVHAGHADFRVAALPVEGQRGQEPCVDSGLISERHHATRQAELYFDLETWQQLKERHVWIHSSRIPRIDR